MIKKLGTEAVEQTRDTYFILAEKIKWETPSYCQSVYLYGGRWAISASLPSQQWYNDAKKVLLHAIKLAPESDGFGLFVNLADRGISFFPINPRDLELSGLLKEARKPLRGGLTMKDIFEGVLDNPSRLLDNRYFQLGAEKRWQGPRLSAEENILRDINDFYSYFDVVRGITKGKIKEAYGQMSQIRRAYPTNAVLASKLDEASSCL